MIEFIKRHKVSCIVIIIILLFIFFIILMPFILNKIYYLKAPCNFFEVGYSVDYILGYYGAVLAFVGTVSLGIITVYQNYIAQTKTDEVNKLTLQLQQKSMALAEQNYERKKNEDDEKNTPKFELKNRVINGRYMNLKATLKNVSDLFVSGIKSVSFEVIDSSKKAVTTSDEVKIKASSLASGEETCIEFNNKELYFDEDKNEYGQKTHDSLKNFSIEWKFLCEDSYSTEYYFKATLHVEDSNIFTSENWRIERIG